MTTEGLIHPKVPFRTAIFDYLVELVMAVTPHDTASSRLKSALMRWRGARIGRGVKIWRDVWVDDYRKLVIGDSVSIGKSAMLQSIGGITIGNHVMIAHGSQLVSAGHHIPEDTESMRFSGLAAAPIVIEDNAWIGAGAIVLPGVRVGHGAVVAAGAVVTKAVEANTIVGGIPAKVISRRK